MRAPDLSVGPGLGFGIVWAWVLSLMGWDYDIGVYRDIYIYGRNMGISQTLGCHFGAFRSPSNKDCSILGLYLVPLYMETMTSIAAI